MGQPWTRGGSGRPLRIYTSPEALSRVPPLPFLPAEVTWGAWGPWGPCSRSCGPGRRMRRRLCSNPAGDGCPGRPLEAQKCVSPACAGRRRGAGSAGHNPGRSRRGDVGA